MNRREFIALSAAGVIAGGAKAAETPRWKPPAGCKRLVTTEAPPRNRRPYAGVDWSRALRVNTTSHGHCLDKWKLEKYLKHNFGLMTISNYYPSAPTMPGATIRKNHIYHRTHKVNYKDKLVDPPKDWTAVVAAHPELISAEGKKKYPIVEDSSLMFPNWPKDMLEAPNAEHHRFWPVPTLHLCAPGSAYASGTFDKWNMYGTGTQGYCPGSGERWYVAVDRLINGLIQPDGGGVTINHPSWSHLDRNFIAELLDWDPRVLGIEVLEAGHNSEHYWDWILSTGRQCFGFFVPDWSTDNDKMFGVNVLVVPEKTVEACLRAYRQGCFYGAAQGYGRLNFTSLSFDGKTVRATVDRPARLEVKTARGVVKEVKAAEIAWDVPETKPWQGAPIEIFARVKAYSIDGDGEILFSQPFML